MRRLGAVLTAACIALAPVPARAADVAWEQWKPIPGALDVDGVRSDGSAQPLEAGVQDGDLLAAAERDGALIAVRCEATCTARRVTGPTKAVAEGHFAFTMQALPARPSSNAPGAAGGGGPTLSPEIVDFVGDWGISIASVALLGALFAILGVQGIRRRPR